MLIYYYRNALRIIRVYAICVEPVAADQLRQRLKIETCQTEVLCGADALAQLAADVEVDVVVAAIVGAAGLQATYAAVSAGKKSITCQQRIVSHGWAAIYGCGKSA